MNNHRETFKEDEIDLKEIFQLLREKSKFILLFLFISLAVGVLYGLYYPKEYDSHSIISIGNVFGTQITSTRDLAATLELIKFSDYTEVNSKAKLEYTYTSLNNLEITASSKSASRAHALNRSVLDTILNRHDNVINKRIQPIDLELQNISIQIDYINDLLQQQKPSDHLVSRTMLQRSQIELRKEKNRIIPTRVIVQPNIPESHSRPNLFKSVFVSLFLGLTVSCGFVIFRDSVDRNQT